MSEKGVLAAKEEAGEAEEVAVEVAEEAEVGTWVAAEAEEADEASGVGEEDVVVAEEEAVPRSVPREVLLNFRETRLLLIKSYQIGDTIKALVPYLGEVLLAMF
mmetsp:Transcript_38880/g.83760  ORF Transcript_38880/g.83760 Transcript_38880/m.83760 type:complete len:104 (-) Transcript_38880:67-378(-)